MGGAPATCVEATVLAAGDPGSNPTPRGPILRVIAPSLPPVSCLSLLTCTLKAKKPKKYTKKQNDTETLIYAYMEGKGFLGLFYRESLLV